MIAAFLAMFAVLFALDLVGNRLLALVMGVLGLLPALLGLPGALARIRRGDSVGTYFIVAWVTSFFAGIVLYGVVTGTPVLVARSPGAERHTQSFRSSGSG